MARYDRINPAYIVYGASFVPAFAPHPTIHSWWREKISQPHVVAGWVWMIRR